MDILSQNVSKKMIILVISIVALFVLGISTTYSLVYNTKKLSNNSYVTGLLDIEYKEGETLNLDNYIPMDDESGKSTKPYTIVIKNNGNLNYKFDLNILSTITEVDNIIDAKYLRIQIDDKEVISLNELTNGLIYSNLILSPNEEMEVTIRMWLSEETPNTEIGHIYSAKLVATGIAIQSTNNLNTKSLAYQTLVKLSLNEYALESNSNIIEKEISEDKYIYYFKGNVQNNYVLFNDSYYRIYMIDENGNIKMIYSGKEAHDNEYDDRELHDTIISSTSYNNLNTDKLYGEYTYLNDNLEETNSNIKTVIDNWYEENIKDTDNEQYIVDTIYCNDTTVNEFDIYNSYDRLINNELPSLECNPADSYSVSEEIGNGILEYPVSLITADELLLVGNEYISNNISFWTNTPSKYELGNIYNYSYDNKLTSNTVDTILGVRPVLTIKSDNLKGTGTLTDPYTIKNEE